MAIAKAPPPEDLNERVFKHLFHILKELTVPKRGNVQAYNYTALSKALGASKPTVKKWDVNPPTQWYWEPVLMEAIARVSQYATLKQRNMIAQEMRRLPAQVGRRMGEAHVALRVLIDELAETSEDDMIPGHQIIRVAEARKVSLFRLREAAQILGVKMVRTKKGKQHESLWYLPTVAEMRAEMRGELEGRDPTNTKYKKRRKNERQD